MELEKGKVTMVIPMYNKIGAIKNTLESVVKYHGNAPFECLIIDDSSTDGSSEVAIEYEAKYPDIFTYVRIQHRGKYGPANARNFGIRLCNSEYICFLDADDELCEGHIDRSVCFLNKHKMFDVYGEDKSVEKDEKENRDIAGKYNPTDINYFIDTINSNFLHFCSCLYRTESINGIKFKDCPGEDMIFLFTVLNQNKFYIDLTKFAFYYHQEYLDVSARYEDTYNISIGERAYITWKTIIEDNPDFPYHIIDFITNEGYEGWKLVRI